MSLALDCATTLSLSHLPSRPLFVSLLLSLSRVVLPRPLNYVALLGCSPGALLLNISFPFALFAGCLVCKMRRCQCQEFSHCVRNSCSSQAHTYGRVCVCVCAACVFLQQFLQQFFLFLPRTWQSRKFNFLFFVYVCEPHFLLSYPPPPPPPLPPFAAVVVVVRFWHFCAWHCIRLAFACPA